MRAHCSFCAGQRIQTDDLLLHPRHALCLPQPRPVRGHRGEAQHAQQTDQDCEAVSEVTTTIHHHPLPTFYIIYRLNSGSGNDESVFGKDAMEELVNTGDISYNHLSSGNHQSFRFCLRNSSWSSELSGYFPVSTISHMEITKISIVRIIPKQWRYSSGKI